MVSAGQKKPRHRTVSKQRALVRCAGTEAPPTLHWRPIDGLRKQSGDAVFQGGLSLGGQSFAETGIALRGGTDHDEAVLARHEVSARAEHHPSQGSPRRLQGEHLPLDGEHRQLRQQLGTPGTAAQHRLATAQGVEHPFGVAGAYPLELLVLGQQLQHFHPFLEVHAAIHTGAFQRPHQLATVVDLAVLAEQQTRGPVRGQAWHFLMQLGAIERLTKGGCGVLIAFFGAPEGHHDAGGAQSAGQAAVGFDLGHPAGNSVQAELSELQQGAAQAFGMGSQHAGGDEPGRFAASSADHGHALPPSGQLVGDRQAHQPATQDQDRSWLVQA